VICPTQSILSRFDPAPRRLANNNNNNGGPSVRAFGLVNFSRSNGLHLSTRVPFGPVCSSAPFLLLFFFAFFEPSATEIKKRNAIYLSTDFSKKKKKICQIICAQWACFMHDTCSNKWNPSSRTFLSSLSTTL
jgi:hypothetical protein